MSDIEKVKQLRKSTGAGFKDCNAALKESNGDLDKAAEILRVKGIAKASKKMSRSATEGVVVISGDEKKMSVKELSELNNNYGSNLEELNNAKMKNNKTVDENLVALIAKIGEKITIGRASTLNKENSRNFAYQHSVIKDNVSKLVVIVSINTNEVSDKIDLFGKQLSMHIAASNPIALNSNQIDQELIDKEVNLIAEELKNSGKPEEIAKKISLGKINKFKEENSLMTQDWVMDPKIKVKDVIKGLEISNLNINQFVRLKIGE
jgi:elongation factor Ts